MSVEWSKAPLGEIFTIARGGSPRPIDDYITESEDGINWIMIGDAVEGTKYIRSTKKKIRKAGVERSRMVKPGDFLLTNSMSFGKPYILQTEGCIHDGWLVLSPREANVCQDYFYHLLGSDVVYSEFAKRASGAVVKNLNIDLVKGVEVPYPPLSEQTRIAAILDKADAIRRKRQQALRLTDDFLRSVFLDMFGDPVTNPNEWPTKQLLELGRVSTGSTPPSSSVEMFGGAIPFITPGDLKDTWTNSARTVTEAGARSARTIRAGAALVCCIGATIGKMGKAKILSAFNQQINAVEWNGLIVDDYGLDTLKFYKQIIASRGSSTTLPILNKSAFQSLEIPVAPIEMQQAYAKIVRQCEAMKNQAVQAQSETEDLFASLQQRAFSGQL